MNRIDKKYKELLEKRTFSKSQREKGWAGMQGMLDSEFPVSGAAAASGTSGAMAWRYGLGILAVAITAGAIWWTLGTAAGAGEVGFYQPRGGEPVVNSFGTESEAQATEKPGQKMNSNSVTAPENQDEERMEGKIVAYEKIPEKNSKSTTGEKGAPRNVAAGQSKRETEGTLAGLNQPVQSRVSNEPEAKPKAVPDAVVPAEDESTASDAVAYNAPPDAQGEDILASRQEVQKTTSEPSLTEERTEVAGNADPGEEREEAADAEARLSENTPEDQLATDTENKAAGEGKGAFSETGYNAEKVIAESDGLNAQEADVTENAFPERETQTAERESSLSQDSLGSEAVAANTGEEKPAALKAADWHFAFPKRENQQEFEIPSLAGKRFALSVYGGYAYVGKLLKSQNPEYLMKREAEEKPIYTTPTGVSIDYFMNSRWTVSIGLGYAEYGEELNYEVTRTDSAFVHGTYGSPSDYQNIISIDSVRVVDSIYAGHWNYNIVYQTEDTAVAQNNGRTSITYLEIPLMVGYRFGQGRVRPWLQSGISLGLPIASSFRYLNEGADGLDEQTTRAIAPLQWNYRVSLGVDCKLGRHWSIRLNGLGSLQLNSLLQGTQASQRYYRLGGQLGLAYNF